MFSHARRAVQREFGIFEKHFQYSNNFIAVFQKYQTLFACVTSVTMAELYLYLAAEGDPAYLVNFQPNAISKFVLV
jgi:hypothetical protein